MQVPTFCESSHSSFAGLSPTKQQTHLARVPQFAVLKGSSAEQEWTFTSAVHAARSESLMQILHTPQDAVVTSWRYEAAVATSQHANLSCVPLHRARRHRLLMPQLQASADERDALDE